MSVSFISGLKEKVHTLCLQVVEEEINSTKAAIAELRASAQTDTKSSAGDKHETSRAMVDLEIQKQEIRLKSLFEKKDSLFKIKPLNNCSEVKLGALIESDSQVFYIATSLGKIRYGETDIVVLSAEAPLAVEMLTLTKNSTFQFRNQDYTILNIL